ncbi:hypothetical protein IFR05_013294 [Cadophora sp. M221]|nr:hypothetical protein IFR05_013294 [Cadophora sp. M221]
MTPSSVSLADHTKFDPQAGDVMGNINKANALLNKANPNTSIFLSCQSLLFMVPNVEPAGRYESVQDFEVANTGPTSLWAREKAIAYKCVVIAGYAEKDEKKSDSPVYYNSAIVVNEDGKFTGNYRKNYLHPRKDKWASHGLEFFHKSIPNLGQVSMGISMDLNPEHLEAPKFAHEFAHEILSYGAELIILPMSWWTGAAIDTKFPSRPLLCWLNRLEPLFRRNRQDEITCVFANRVGTEGEDVYVGKSAVVKIGYESLKVCGALGSTEEDLLVVDTQA